MALKTITRRAAALAMSFAFLLNVTASVHAQPTMVESGKLTYGVNATFAPFEFQKDDSLVGLDIDLADNVAKRLHLSAAPLNMEFQGLIPALAGLRIDFINSAMYINPERAAQVDFIPYLRLGNQLVVQKGNPHRVSGRDETLCGVTAAVTLAVSRRNTPLPIMSGANPLASLN